MFTLDDMRHVAKEAYGQLGVTIVDQWNVFNRVYYYGALRPIPIFITQSQPFGKRIAYCTGGNGPRHIALNIPNNHTKLVADNCTLLHEMLHQYLHERGECAKHSDEPWRREIMRITRLITGNEIWAGPSSVRRINGKPNSVPKVASRDRRCVAEAIRYRLLAARGPRY